MVDIKETVKAMCKALPGGRQAMAGALGMTVDQFNNNLYEKNGCRFFEHHELEAMEDLSGTNLLTEYFARRRGLLLVDVPKFDDLDRVELYSRSVYTAAMRGQVDQMINEAIEDGVIDEHEAKEITSLHTRHLAAREAEIRCMLALFGRNKRKRL
ncbi:YmfL family putative regulatory protein [Brenneria populi subsp. brevivirga]|uniref:YmfL family putative regulatory protein n=1 Tax=Brenneria populi TaxID=1505588 RepID=UPI002E17E62F|nr:YmfL family putative regulatory protein [Brenneria populi subsp. brevivirga]